jgi:hypothetical protein
VHTLWREVAAVVETVSFLRSTDEVDIH